MIDYVHMPFLFSIGTRISYRIAKEYYHNVQYVWCAPHFDSPDQPPTSNPQTIAKRYIEQIKSGDRHSKDILSNKAGILNGAKDKYSKLIINEKQNKEIRQFIGMARYQDFFPVLFVINSKKVSHKCQEVEVKYRATDTSIEYIIPNLMPDEYELIDLKKLYDGIISLSDRRVGE